MCQCENVKVLLCLRLLASPVCCLVWLSGQFIAVGAVSGSSWRWPSGRPWACYCIAAVCSGRALRGYFTSSHHTCTPPRDVSITAKCTDCIHRRHMFNGASTVRDNRSVSELSELDWSPRIPPLTEWRSLINRRINIGVSGSRGRINLRRE